MLSDWVRLILQATVYDAAIQTPLEPAKKLSERFNNDIRFKREDFQPVFSFKLRGAYNRISQLSEVDKAKGVICASAGNHAQGVAFSASRLGLNNIIVMPTTTPDIKVSAVKSLGGNVVLYGDSFDESNRYAIERAQTDGLTFIPPYDDELVIAGQGTIAMELVQQWRKMEYVFVAVGGGGLISGVAAFLGEVAPHVKVVAVEPEKQPVSKSRLIPVNASGYRKWGCLSMGWQSLSWVKYRLPSAVCQKVITQVPWSSLMWSLVAMMKCVRRLKTCMMKPAPSSSLQARLRSQV